MNLVRSRLFEIPMWLADFSDVVPHHDVMARELDELLDNPAHERAPSQLGHQTTSDPFDLPSDGWRVLERLTNQAFSEVLKTSFRRQRSGEFHQRRWALRLGRLSPDEKARLESEGLHNHLPALFSSVYYLRVPDDLENKPEGGTLFVNPLANVMDLIGPRTTAVEPREGRFVVFPSFVDHKPLPIQWDAGPVARLVISCDVFFVSGKAKRVHREAGGAWRSVSP